MQWTMTISLLCCALVAAADTAAQFSMSMTEEPGDHWGISISTTGMTANIRSAYSGIVLDTPAGKITIGAGFPGIKRRMRTEGLSVLRDDASDKLVEHSFLCESDGKRMEWVNLFYMRAGLPAVAVESRLVNLSRELGDCYQFWTLPAPGPSYFNAEGKFDLPPRGISSLIAPAGWVYFKINDRGGIGLLADLNDTGAQIFNNGGVKGVWGIRLTNQGRLILPKGRGSTLKFILFFAENPARAAKLAGELKAADCFCGLGRENK